MNVFYLFVAIGIFASSCSQLLLKTSADRHHSNPLTEILNPRVLLAYAIFFGSMLVNTIALGHGVKVKDLPVLEALGYIFVPLLSFLFLHEHITKRLVFSVLLIGSGICVFYL